MSTHLNLNESEATSLKMKTEDDEIKILQNQFEKQDHEKILEMMMRIIRRIIKVGIKRKYY